MKPNIAINAVKYSTMSSKRLLYIAGPTAVGKTALSIALAKALNTEIISCDARQCYREMSIGTVVPSEEERANIPHHFIQNKSIHQPFDAGAFEKEGLELLERLFHKHHHVVMVGGSGLYAKALIEGLDKFPEIDPNAAVKVKLIHQKEGLEGLQKQLKEKDRQYYKTVDLNNPRRLIRALEVCETSKKPYSSFLGQSPKKRHFTSQTLLLKLPREQLYDRINRRVEQMVKAGLEKEAQSLYSHKNLPALQTVGYRELFDHFDGKYSHKEAIDEIQKNTRRYAKRQMTWFNQRDVQEIPIQVPLKALKMALKSVEDTPD
jgi:tRNA dimethylallyltransferase